MKEYFTFEPKEEIASNSSLSFKKATGWSDKLWLEGIHIDVDLPLPIEYNLKGNFKGQLPELFSAMGGALVCAEKYQRIFEGLSDHLAFFSSEIVFRERRLEQSFVTLNFSRNFEALDLNKSVYETYDDGLDISWIDSLILSANKIAAVPKTEHIFRLGEYPSILVCDIFAKKAISEKIADSTFTKIEVV